MKAQQSIQEFIPKNVKLSKIEEIRSKIVGFSTR